MVALPGLITWGIGIPAATLFILVKFRKRLQEPNVKTAMGFLYLGYTELKYYWEFMILYRKIAIAFISVFLVSVSIEVQALTAFLVLMFAFYFQTMKQPFTTVSLNKLEVSSILVAGVTIYCGLYYLSGHIGEITKLVLFIIIVLINSTFIGYWIYLMSNLLCVKLLQKCPFLLLLLERCKRTRR